MAKKDMFKELVVKYREKFDEPFPYFHMMASVMKR